MEKNYGSRRVVVGAHYGLRDWLSQRVTALLMALFTVVLLVQVLWPTKSDFRWSELYSAQWWKALWRLLTKVLTDGKLDYYRWSEIFSAQWMKVLTFVVIVSLAWHAWVGVRDIWMDYVKPVALRLGLQVFTIVWLVGCAGWAIQVLWRL